MKKLSFLLALTFTLTLISAAQNLSGSWSGPFKSNGPAGTFDLTLAQNAGALTGDVTVRFGGREVKAPLAKTRSDAGKLEFSADLDGGDTNFIASVEGNRIRGTFEVFEKHRRTLVGSYCLAKAGSMLCGEGDVPPVPNVQTATQRADDSFDTSVGKPAYTSNGPKVLFDEAHKNFHKTTGNFKPFADLIRNDGYAITANPEPFSAATLKAYKMLVIVNARGEGAGSAFTDAEIDAVVDWVNRGGSLLLVADHTPFGGYSEKLANRFGVDMSKGYTDDPQSRDPVIKDLLFSRENNLLGDHPITRGRNANERLGRIVSFTGQSLKSSAGTPILKLADTAYDEFPNSDKKIPAAGRSQAIAMKFGKGKVFVSGEAGMLTAQISADDHKFGMNVAGIDNRQYALNIVHWLSGLLK